MTILVESRRPLLLDLFCGAGGAAMGYHRAGFDVVGVDIAPQPYYPFPFIRGDALAPPVRLDAFDAIHASPPCQAFTQMSARWRKVAASLATTRLDLLTPTLEMLRELPIPWVVENVVGARRAMRATIMLHGGMFGLRVNRPRLFESSVMILAPPSSRARGIVGVYGTAPDGRRLYSSLGRTLAAAKSLEEAQDAMDMDWADWGGTKEAIPPAYTEWIGSQLLAYVGGPR